MRKLCICWFVVVLCSQKQWGPQITNPKITKIYGPQIANSKNATFVEGPQIYTFVYSTNLRICDLQTLLVDRPSLFFYQGRHKYTAEIYEYMELFRRRIDNLSLIIW